MCAPAAVAVAGVAMQAYSQYQQGQASSRAAEYNAKMTDYNATLADSRSTDALERGDITANQIQTEGAGQIGEGRAGFASGNVDLASGSVKYWELDTASGVAKDVALTRYNAGQEAAGIQGEAWNARASSRLSRAQGRSARRAGILGAGSSLLAGASETAYRFRTPTPAPAQPRYVTV